MVDDLERFVRRVGAGDNTTKRQTARCPTFVFSVQIEGLAYKPSDIATTRRTTTRPLACFARDRTTRRERDNGPFGALSCSR
jgi:hypothetical protein